MEDSLKILKNSCKGFTLSQIPSTLLRISENSIKDSPLVRCAEDPFRDSRILFKGFRMSNLRILNKFLKNSLIKDLKGIFLKISEDSFFPIPELFLRDS